MKHVYKAYWFNTSQEFFFTKRPTLKDLEKITDEAGLTIKEWEITKIEVSKNK